jgi:hypothetical protein
MQRGGTLNEELKTAVLAKRAEEMMEMSGVQLPEEPNSNEEGAAYQEVSAAYSPEQRQQDEAVADKLTDEEANQYINGNMTWDNLVESHQ